MDDKYIKDAYDSIKTSDEVMIGRVKNGLQDSEDSTQRAPLRRRFSRKFVPIAAAMVMVLAFGAVAYANGWFNLGVIDSKDDSYEIIAVEDSNQYKAAKEVADYYDSQTFKDMYGKSGEGWLDENGSTLHEEDKDNIYMTMDMNDKTVLKIIDKYGLKYEKTYYYTNTAKEAMDKAGVVNFLGEFADIDKLKADQSSAYTQNAYTYTKEGSVDIMGGRSDSSQPVYWELSCIPEEVYITPSRAFVYQSEKESPQFAEWNFTTEDGYQVKAATFTGERDTFLEDGSEEIRKYRHYKALLFVNGHAIALDYDIWTGNPKDDVSADEFEKLIDKFDFSKLQ